MEMFQSDNETDGNGVRNKRVRKRIYSFGFIFVVCQNHNDELYLTVYHTVQWHLFSSTIPEGRVTPLIEGLVLSFSEVLKHSAYKVQH